MRLNQLFEGISDVVFHITSLQDAAKIIQDDKFILTHSFKNTSEEDASSKKLFFMSTSRSPTNDYNQKFRDDMVLMKLDGRKLAQRYAGEPVSYFTGNYRRLDNDEMEDRVLSDKPIIPDAKDYILEMHVSFGESPKKEHLKYYRILKASGIPTYLYQNKYAALTMQPKNRIDLSFYDLDDFGVPMVRMKPDGYDRNASKKSINRYKEREGDKPKVPFDVSMWLQLMQRPPEQYKDLHYHYKDILDELTKDIEYGTSYGWNRFTNDMRHADVSERAKIGKIMKSNGLKNTKDLYRFIYDRWKEYA